nr:hypothetical protein [Tanacetum cinerariifolium]
MTDAYPSQRGPLPPVVFREPDQGKYKPLPEKKSATDRYILQKRSEEPTESSGRGESLSLYAELDYFEAEKAEKQAKKRRKQDSPKTPPGSPPHLHHHHHQAHQGRLDLPAPLILQEPPPLPPPSSSHQGYQSTSTA